MAPRRALLVAAIAFVAMPCLAAAQIEPGGKVRVSVRKEGSGAGMERLTGIVVALEGGALALDVRGKGAVLVSYGDILGIEASRGRSKLRGMGRGVLIAAGVGAIAGLVQGDDPPGFMAFSATDKAMIFGVLAVPVGAVIGAVVGVERWERVEPARVRLSLLPVRGGAGVSVSVGFSGRGKR